MRIELRSNSVILDGYVNVTQRESRILPSPKGPFVEEIKPRTFERALQNNNSVDLLFNHDHNRKLGSTNEGNLELFEDNIGLRAIATVTDQVVMEKARNKELRGWSFGFSVLKDEWLPREDAVQKRFVEEIELFEVSILDKTPAYIATSIESRDGEESILTETRNEEFDAKIDDKSSDLTDNNKKPEETNENANEKDEKREIPKNYFEILEKETILMQLQGGFHNK